MNLESSRGDIPLKLKLRAIMQNRRWHWLHKLDFKITARSSRRGSMVNEPD